MKKTVILGATTNRSRYAYLAAEKLHHAEIAFVPVGLKKGEVFGEEILRINEKPNIRNVHTITMYVGARNQIGWYDYILSLQPKRIIFNPGSENPELARLAVEKGIQVENACTLVLLTTGSY